MLSIQSTFSTNSSSSLLALKEVDIDVAFPQFAFVRSNGNIQRFVKKHLHFKVTQKTDENDYQIKLPLYKVIAEDLANVHGFFQFHFVEILNAGIDINHYSFPFKISIKSSNGQSIISETL